jgi:four helix bundle protein
MKLDAWQRGMDLFSMAFRLTASVSDLKLRSQFRDAAQSVSANIGEGYGRRSLPEYIQFLYIAKGSLGESLTRAIGFRAVEAISLKNSRISTNCITRWKTSCSDLLSHWKRKSKPTIGAIRSYPHIQ